MITNRILTLVALAATVTLTPGLFAGECSASKDPSAATCTAGKDLVAENGVIHVIDTVMIPKA